MQTQSESKSLINLNIINLKPFNLAVCLSFIFFTYYVIIELVYVYYFLFCILARCIELSTYLLDFIALFEINELKFVNQSY